MNHFPLNHSPFLAVLLASAAATALIACSNKADAEPQQSSATAPVTQNTGPAPSSRQGIGMNFASPGDPLPSQGTSGSPGVTPNGNNSAQTPNGNNNAQAPNGNNNAQSPNGNNNAQSPAGSNPSATPGS